MTIALPLIAVPFFLPHSTILSKDQKKVDKLTAQLRGNKEEVTKIKDRVDTIWASSIWAKLTNSRVSPKSERSAKQTMILCDVTGRLPTAVKLKEFAELQRN